MREIKTISIKDKNYPELLKKISDAPETIYYKGVLKTQEPCFAVVGTRMNSAYGKQSALEIASELARAGLTIVSGLAPGIDTFCHRAVVDINKRTIAVLGTGIDESSIYPKSNINLSRDIVESGGCLISEYPPGTQGSRFTFPQRNRIISGLSLGTLVIEAKQKSGALITANNAFQQKRKVFAVPGSIYALNSKGCNYLIKKGAKLAESARDILKELNIGLSKFDSDNPAVGDNKEETFILQALSQEAMDIDRIIEHTKLAPANIAASLTVLEIKGMVRNLGGNVYAIRR